MAEGFFDRVKKVGREVRRTLRIAAPATVDPLLYHGVTRLAEQERKKDKKLGRPDYEPRFIARGGEHLVFEFENPKHRDVVYKINYFQSKPFVRAQDLESPAADRARRELIKSIKDRQEQRRVLREYFGFQAVPVVRDRIEEVPVSLDMIAILDPNALVNPKNIPDKVPALVSVQRKIDMPRGDRTISLTGYHPEVALRDLGTEAASIYDMGNDVLTGGQMSEFDPERQRVYALAMYQDLRPVANACEQDSQFKEHLQKVVRQMIRYTNETGTVLDLAGKNNVVLYQDGDRWQLKLIDPLFAIDISVDDIKRAADRLSNPAGPEGPYKPTLEQTQRILGALNTVRVINALALLADIPDRLEIPNLNRVPSQTWQNLGKTSGPKKQFEQAA